MNLICTICLLPCFIYAQHTDTLVNLQGLRVLTGGSIDILQTGQVTASARLFKLYVGEPGKFKVPISVYTGVTANHLSKKNELIDAIHTLMNPGIGMLSLSIDGRSRIAGKNEHYTKLFLNYRTALRVVNIDNATFNKNISTLNFISGTGIFFTTGAWEHRNADDVGSFWLTMQFFYSNVSGSLLSELFLIPLENHIICGMAGLGVELKGVVQLKANYYRAINHQLVKYFREGQLQISALYDL